MDIYISFNQVTSTDSISPSIIRQTLEKNDLRELIQYWITGATVDFRQLKNNYCITWMDLPKYVFDHNIEFDFIQYQPLISIENVHIDEDIIYLNLLGKITEGILSEEEFTKAIMM
jgi:hypothetical protein